MVDHSAPGLDDVFHALADPTRRAMLATLARRPQSVGELAAPFAITLAAASKHIQVLERAGLIRREVQGRVHLCRMDPRPLHAGLEWIRHYERFWNRRLDELQRLLESEDAAADAHGASARPAAPLSARKSRTRASSPTCTPRRTK